MRTSRAVIVGLILLALVGVTAWFFSKPGAVADQATAPGEARPAAHAEQQPVTASEAAGNSVAQADSTGAASPPSDAANRLDMRSLASCHDALLTQQAADSRVGCEKIPANDEAALNFCRGLQAKMVQQAQEAAAGAASCPPGLAHASAYYAAMKDLALRGDVPAQRCFIQGYFASGSAEDETARLKAEQLEEYPGLAKKFIQAAFERGDWSVVRWLGRTSVNIQDGMLRQAYPFGSDHLDTAYRMKYLLLLGKQPDLEGNEARRLTDFWKQNKALTAEQIQQAEAWSKEMYDQHFNGSQEGASVSYDFCERQ